MRYSRSSRRSGTIARLRERGGTVTLKVKYADFHQITRSLTCDAPVATQATLEQISCALLEPVFPVQQGIRLLGVALSSLGGDAPQNEGQPNLSLWLNAIENGC
jgi:DNA polymerase IV